MTLTPEESARYARHLVLKGIGGPGQQKIRAARVLVVGAGGLGSPAIAYLAAAGVGVLGIADPDIVSRSNLQRQIVFTDADEGAAKTGAARRFVAAINPHVKAVAHALALDATNAPDIVGAYDVVLEGTDDFAVKRLVANACERAHIPLVSGSLSQFDGALTVLMPYRDANPGFADLFPKPHPPRTAPRANWRACSTSCQELSGR